MDISMSEWSFDVMPICMARPVADTGASITGGRGPGGQRGADRGHALRDQLACLQQVDVGVEDQLDRRQLRHRLGAQVVQAVDAVEGLLERHA